MAKSFFGVLTARNWPILALLISLSLWLGALGFQHIAHMAPCQMCYWQRHPHKAILGISALALLIRFILKSDKYERTFITLIGLVFLISFGLAFWHVGVEYKWWTGPQSCMGGSIDINPDDILAALNKPVALPSCGDVPWSLFGISMAGYNAIISAGAALLSFFFAAKGKQS